MYISPFFLGILSILQTCPAHATPGSRTRYVCQPDSTLRDSDALRGDSFALFTATTRARRTKDCHEDVTKKRLFSGLLTRDFPKDPVGAEAYTTAA